MSIKTYTCKGCGNTEEIDLEGKFTFPQCRKCCAIMAEHIEYDARTTEYIKKLEAIWYKYYPDVPVQIQMIYRNNYFKFRWFNNPSKDEVRGNKAFIQEYIECAEDYGCLQKRIKHGRIFKSYTGRTEPFRTWKDLTEDEKLQVADFVQDNIEQMFVERYAHPAFIMLATLNSPIPEIDAEEGERIENYVTNYWCKKCQEMIAEDEAKDMDAKMIQHIIDKHL